MLDLSAVPIVDQHAHNLLRPERAGAFAYPSAFTEGYAAEVVTRHVQETLFFRRSMREIAELLGCAPDLGSVLAARERLGADRVLLGHRCAAAFQALLLDDGFMPDEVLPTAWHRRFAPTYRLLRVEFVAERLIVESPSWPAFEEAFRAALETLGPDVVGFKIIVAYRTGLAVEAPEEEGARAAFEILRRRAAAGERVRLALKPGGDGLSSSIPASGTPIWTCGGPTRCTCARYWSIPRSGACPSCCYTPPTLTPGRPRICPLSIPMCMGIWAWPSPSSASPACASSSAPSSNSPP